MYMYVMLNKADLDEVLVCNENDSIFDVSLMLRQTFSKHCIVLDDNNCLKGIVSLQDIIFRGVCEDFDLKLIQVSQIMSTNVESIVITESFDEICDKLTSYSTHYFPVIDENNEVLGGIDIWKLWSKIKICNLK